MVVTLDDDIGFTTVANVKVGQPDRVPEGVSALGVRLGVLTVALNLPVAVIDDVIVGSVRH
jgi:hypothetical protein